MKNPEIRENHLSQLYIMKSYLFFVPKIFKKLTSLLLPFDFDLLINKYFIYLVRKIIEMSKCKSN